MLAMGGLLTGYALGALTIIFTIDVLVRKTGKNEIAAMRELDDSCKYKIRSCINNFKGDKKK